MDAGKTRSARGGVSRKEYEKVYAEFGLVKIKLPKGPRPTWSEAHKRYGDCIVSTTRHIAAIVYGDLHDTHDCRAYDWEEDRGSHSVIVRRERKAMSVYVLGGAK